MAKNVVLVSGGPGLYSTKDVEHDKSWANYVTPPLLKTKADLIGSAKRDVLWIVYKPSYDDRWADDVASKRSSVADVKKKGFGSYVDLIEGRAKKKGWILHWSSDASDVWKTLKGLSDEIDRLWYWGHARNDLWLSLSHSSSGTAIAPPSSAILAIADIPSSLNVSTGGPPPRHRFIGCNTSLFAKAWSKTFSACTEGVDQKIDFGGIHASGGDPDLVGSATIDVYCGGAVKSGTTWAYLAPEPGEDAEVLLAETDADAHEPLDAMAASVGAGWSITLDPGHGGDAVSGTSTPLGVRSGAHDEKTVTLALAQALAARLGGGVRLTRDADVNRSIGDRIASASGSHVFISLHANGGGPADRGPMTLVHTNGSAASAQLARAMQGALAAATGHDRGVGRAELAVLSPAHHDERTAACLVEAEFLTHPDGARWLTDASLRDELADALAAGVREYAASAGLAAPRSQGAVHGAHELYGGRQARYGSMIAFGHLARALSTVSFPSGETLTVVSLPTGVDDEHHDPKGSGNPLLDTSGSEKKKKVSDHFTVGELTRSGKRKFDVARIDPELVRCLEALRVHVGKAVKITSGYRSWAYNKALYEGRKKRPTKSEHCSGRAADVQIEGMSGLEIAKAVIEAWGCGVGLGLAAGFAHVDVRGSFVTWQYASSGYPKSQADADLAELRRFHRQHCRGGAPAGQALSDDQIELEEGWPSADEETDVEEVFDIDLD